MKRSVENIQRITYSIDESEVRSLIKEHSHDLAGEDKVGPVFAKQTTMVRREDGGYDIITEYQARED